MTKIQKLGFYLSGLCFLAMGVIMTYFGFSRSIISLKWSGISFVISGLFWLFFTHWMAKSGKK